MFATAVMALTFQELFARILFEECLMYDRTVKIVKHKLKDGLNLPFGITRVMCQGSILKVQSVRVSAERQCQRTHGPRSRIRRARYIEAAATWLCRYDMKR